MKFIDNPRLDYLCKAVKLKFDGATFPESDILNEYFLKPTRLDWACRNSPVSFALCCGIPSIRHPLNRQQFNDPAVSRHSGDFTSLPDLADVIYVEVLLVVP